MPGMMGVGPDEEQATASTLTANPCTAVTMTSPVDMHTTNATWSLPLGQSMQLSASGTCPAGQVPEYQYWQSDSFGNFVAIGGFVPGAITYNPALAGGICLQVRVRAVGSTDQWHAKSAFVCGVVFTPVPSPTIIPIPSSTARPSTTPTTGIAAQYGGSQWDASKWTVLSTAGLAYPLPVHVGDQINAFRVFGNKGSNSSTWLSSRLMSIDSSTGLPSIAAGAAQNNANAPGPFVNESTGLGIPIVAGHTYVIYMDSTSGSSQDSWLDAEITITRPFEH